MRLRLLLSTVLVCLLLTGLAPTASAGEQWCEWDPVVVITTPGGSTVPVYLTNRVASPEHLPFAVLAETRYTAEPTPDRRGTHVHLFVLIRSGALVGSSATHSIASSEPFKGGTVYAQASGHTGRPMELVFDLAVP